MGRLSTNDNALRRQLSWLLILIATGILLGRLASVRSSRRTTPSLSANDRSRWSTIRALVDHHTYAVDEVIFDSSGVRHPDWYSIDVIQHVGSDGDLHYYSSKPTLLTTLCAAPYWVIHQVSGAAIATRAFYVMRLTLVLVHILPLVGMLVLLARWLEANCVSLWTQLFVLAAAAFATPLTTFAVSLNNHVPAAVLIWICTWATWSIWQSASVRSGLFVVAGLLSGLAVACELPALSYLALVGLLLLSKSPKWTLIGFLPPVAIVTLASIGTNYLAHGTWSTPYAHRRDGTRVAEVNGVAEEWLRPGRIESSLRDKLSAANVIVSGDAMLSTRPLNRGHQLFDPATKARYALRVQGNTLHVHEWDNWYEFEGSYWPAETKGVDRGEASQAVYAFHTLLGHHGFFSLTPIWLISVIGMGLGIVNGDQNWRGLTLATALLTITCFVFYIALRPIEDRNYGGISCCFRWALWLVPLWLACLVPALQAMESHAGWRWLGLGLLTISVFSAFYNSHNPWSHPWLFDYWTYLGWIRYP